MTEKLKSIEEGLVSKETLEDYIKKYFNIKKNLSKFKRRNCQGVVELFDEDISSGYVFVGTTPYDKNIESRIKEMKKLYCGGRKAVVLEYFFIDFEKEIAGFSWRSLR